MATHSPILQNVMQMFWLFRGRPVFGRAGGLANANPAPETPAASYLDANSSPLTSTLLNLDCLNDFDLRKGARILIDDEGSRAEIQRLAWMP